MNQKGFSSLFVIGIVAVLGIGFYIGVTFQKTIVSNVSELLSSPEPSITPTPEPSAAPSQSQSPASNTKTETYNAQKPYSSTTSSDQVIFKGTYMIGDFDKVGFTMILPKKGGAITGDSSGACTTKLTGNMDTPDGAGDAKIQGSLEGTCKPVPRFSGNTAVNVKFEGMAHMNSGKIDVVYESTNPFANRGYFNMYFTP